MERVVVLLLGVAVAQLSTGRIYWWRKSWAPAPAVLSRNNAQESSVQMTLYFNVETAVTEGVLEVTLPEGFTVSGLNGRVLQVPKQTYIAGEDCQVVVSGLINPSTAGPYGPVSLRTRSSPTSQTLDINLLFASLYIESPPLPLASLQVALSGAASTNVINRSGNTLAFKAQLKVPLWRYDLFELDISPLWTVGQVPVCLSAPLPGKINYYNGSDSSNPRLLACTVTAKTASQVQKVYIYGLAVDLPGGAEDSAVQLLLSPVSTPAVAYFPSMFVWKLTTLRSGSSTVLEVGTYSSGPIVAPDILTVATWKPTWGLEKADIQPRMVLYMDLSFTVVNAIPAGGHVTLVVTEDVCTESWGKGTDPTELVAVNCYIVAFISATATCETSSRSTITVSHLPAIPAKHTFLIRNLVSVVSAAGATAQILSINTYDGDSINIDTGSNLQPFQVSTGTTSRLAAGFTMVSTGAKAGDWGNALTYLSFLISPKNKATEFVSTSVVTVTCPLTSAPSDFAIYIPANGRVKKWVLGTNLTPGSDFNSGGNPAFGSDLTIAGNSIRWQAGSAMTGLIDITFGINTAGPAFVTMPLVASNQATAYECSLRIQDQATPPKLTQVFTSAFRILPQSWAPTPRFSLVCSNNIPGAPAFVTFRPLLVGIRQETGKTFMLEVGFAVGTATGMTGAGLGSGLLSGSVYPHACAPDIPNTSANLVFSDTRNYVRIQGLGPVSPTTTLTVFFPIAGVVVGAGLKATIRSCYQLPNDPTTRYITHEGTSTYVTTPTASSSFPTISATGNTAKVSAEGVQLNLTLKQSQFTGSTQWIYIVLPKGYRWTDNKKVTMGLLEYLFPASYFFTSPSESFPSAGVLLQTSAAGVYVDWLATSTLHIYGYCLPKSRPSRNVYLTVVTGGGNGLETSACLNTSFKDVQMTADAGVVTGLHVTPSTVVARGPDSVDITQEVGLRLEHGLDAGGFIVVVLDGNWATTPCTSCWATELKNLSNEKAVTCTYVGNTVTITQFSDFPDKQEVRITIAHLLPPKSVSGSPYDFLTSVTTRTSTSAGYQVVDQYQVTAALRVTVQSGGATGVPTWLNKRLYPDAAGMRADVHLQFQLPHAIPKCGTIRITATGGWAALQGNLKDSCYFSPVMYESCILSGVELQVTLGIATGPGTKYELYLDSAVDCPTPDTPIQNVFIVSSYWFTETLDVDSVTLMSLQQAASTNPSPPKSMSVLRFEPVPATKGVLADYSLSLQDSLALLTGHQIWLKFPSDFDYFLGEATKSVTGSYQLPCSSPHLPSLNCTASHSMLRFTVSTPWPAHTPLEVTFFGLRNPYVSRTGLFAVWHLDAELKCVAAVLNVAFLELRSAPGKVDFRSVEMSNRDRGELANATFRLYLYGNVTANSTLRIRFPLNYDLNQANYTCNVSIVDTSQAISLQLPLLLESVTSCQTANRTLTLSLGPTSRLYTSQLLVSLTIFNLSNPLWGWPRVALAPGRDFDAWDFVTFPKTSFWAQKLSVELVAPSREVLACSYAQLHAGYSGFNAPGRTILVNGATLGLLDRPIEVSPGTQTPDLLFSTASPSQPCEAKRLILTAQVSALTPDQGQLSFTSQFHQFTLAQGFWSAAFRISAGKSVLPGEYVVDWKVEETVQSGVSAAQYAQPLSSRISVKAAGPVSVVFAAVPDVWPGTATPPIRVWLSNSPATLLNVHIYVLGAPRAIIVLPSVLSFRPDDNERFFLINVTNGYVQSEPISLKSLIISLSGPDAGAYSCSASLPFHLLSNSSWPSAALSLQLQALTPTAAVLRPSATVPGTLYWWLGVQGSAQPSFATLYRSVPSLLSAPHTSPEERRAKAQERSETDPGYRENWSGFQRRLYRAHISSTWTGALALSDPISPPTLDLTWLWAETTYTLQVFLDPMTAKSQAERVDLMVNFTTLPCPPPQPLRVKFQGSLAPAFATKIASLLAKHIGIHPQRLHNGTLVLSTSRRLQNYTYSSFLYSLLPNRFAPDPSPEVQSRLIGDTYLAFEADIQSELGISNPLLSVTPDYFPTRKAVGWTQVPQPLSSTNSSASLHLRASSAGLVCCVALNTTAPVPSPTQVFIGVDALNSPRPQGCISTNTSNATNTLKVQGLDSGRHYFVYCIATDDYPLWATLMGEKDLAKVEVLTLTYNATQQQDLSEGWAAALSALVVIVLV